MRYIKLEKRKTTYVDGMKKVHETNYQPNPDGKYTEIRWTHISENVARLDWKEYDIFIFKGDYWFHLDNAFKTFHEAYNAAKRVKQ
jgi:hypothetical protein